MTLRYWVATCKDDSRAYSLRGRTKREVVALLVAEGHYAGRTFVGDLPGVAGEGARYGPPTKVEIQYKDAFDLLLKIVGEGGLGRYEED